MKGIIQGWLFKIIFSKYQREIIRKSIGRINDEMGEDENLQRDLIYRWIFSLDNCWSRGSDGF